MDHPKGAGKTDNVRLSFDRRVRLEFHGSKISSDGGLLVFRELDEVLGLHDIAGGLLRDKRTGRNRLHTLVGLLRQSVFGRLAGYGAAIGQNEPDCEFDLLAACARGTNPSAFAKILALQCG